MHTIDKPDELEIAEPMARTLWLCAYADAHENGELDGPRPGSGEDWDDYAPETPPEALTKAEWILELIRDPGFIAYRWMMDTGLDLERFGHCLALQILGHGVGLGDDYPSHIAEPHTALPHEEFSIYEVDLSKVEGITVKEGKA